MGIQKEFCKVEKKKNEDEKIFTRIEKIILEEDDPELVKKREEEKNVDEKTDKIEQMFAKDKIELDNFFYVNPYAYLTNKEKKKEENKEEEKDGDVFYDKKKGKIVIKELNYVKNKKKDG